MNTPRKNKFSVGIYGDGQLARLLAQEAALREMHLEFFSVSNSSSPCEGLGEFTKGISWQDEESFLAFSKKCDVIVLENEFIPEEFLKLLPENFVTIPNSKSYSALSDKFKQVQLAEKNHIPVPKYKIILRPEELNSLVLPVMLKCLRGGYDGYGNFLLDTKEKMPEAQIFIESRGISLAQEFIAFDLEVATLVASDGKDVQVFPVVETIQEKNICHFVVSPPRLSSEIQEKISSYAKNLIQSIEGIGLYGIEFFVKGDEVIFNEIAPRPHNSGHYSIEACPSSQYGAILDLIEKKALTPPTLKTEAVGMLNLLGTQNGKAHFEGDERFHKLPNGKLHLYGKEESRRGRKMGHFTLMGNNLDAILKELKELKERYSI